MKSPYVARAAVVANRRRFLKGLGVGLALPALECMTPAFAKSADRPPKRMLLISNNLGVLPGPFFPQETGPDYRLSPYLQVLKDHRSDFTVFSGLSHPNVNGGHSTENCFLTAAKDPTGSGFRNTISLDQFAVERLGQQTRFPTLNLGVNLNTANRSLSWTRDGALLPAQVSPAAVFKQMFLAGSKADVARQLRRLKTKGSILDVVNDDLKDFQRGLGRQDKARLDQYFTSIRSLETRLDAAKQWVVRPKPEADIQTPVDILDRAQFFPKLDLMLSMAQLAFESDSTRIVTLMVDAFATPVFEINAEEKSLHDYHNLSHHGRSKEKMAQLERVDRRQMEALNKLLGNLAARTTGGGRLLDDTMVLFGSNMGDANVHNNNNLPVLLAGGGFKHGQHVSFDHENNTPLCNLFVTMLQNQGIESEHFGSSTGTPSGLS